MAQQQHTEVLVLHVWGVNQRARAVRNFDRRLKALCRYAQLGCSVARQVDVQVPRIPMEKEKVPITAVIASAKHDATKHLAAWKCHTLHVARDPESLMAGQPALEENKDPLSVVNAVLEDNPIMASNEKNVNDDNDNTNVLATLGLNTIKVLILVIETRQEFDQIFPSLLSRVSEFNKLECVVLHGSETRSYALAFQKEFVHVRSKQPAPAPLGILFWESSTNVAKALNRVKQNFALYFIAEYGNRLATYRRMDRAANVDHGEALFRSTFEDTSIAFEEEVTPNSITKVFEHQRCFVDPNHPCSEEFECVGLPSYLCLGEMGSKSESRQERPNLSKHFEGFRLGLAHTLLQVRELLENFAAHSVEFKLKGEHKYWRESSLYLIASLVGWIVFIEEKFSSEALREVRALFCPVSALQDLVCFFENADSAFVAMKINDKLVEVGQSMRGKHILSPSILRYTTFKRQLSRHPTFADNLLPLARLIDRFETDPELLQQFATYLELFSF